MNTQTPASEESDDVREMLALGLGAVPFAALLFRPDDALTLLWRNKAHEVMSASEGRSVFGQGMFEAFPPSDDAEGAGAVTFIREAVERIRTTRQPEEVGPSRFDLLGEDGSYVEHHWQMHFAPIERDGELVAILQTAQDVTAATLTKRLAESHRRAATSTASVAYFSFDPETQLFERHDAIDKMFGFAPDEAGPYAGPFFERVHPEDIDAVYAEVARIMAAPEGEVASFDYRIVLPDGGERFVRIRGEIATDPSDRRSKLFGTFVDLTDIENARRALERSVHAREALVVEANHRIKNSIQIALSLLRMQAAKFVTGGGPFAEEARDALKSVEARIRAVADVHGAIQIDDDAAQTNLITLFTRLVASTRKSAELPEDAMVFTHPAKPVSLKSDSAIALSLMLNELLTNAIKYGAPDAENPVTLTLTAKDDEDIVLTVENTHAGGNPSIDIESSGTGTRLIQQFGDQIGAEVTQSDDGSRFVAQIKISPDR